MKKSPMKKRPMKEVDSSFAAFLKREHSKAYHRERNKLLASHVNADDAKKRAQEAGRRRIQELRDQAK